MGHIQSDADLGVASSLGVEAPQALRRLRLLRLEDAWVTQEG